MPTCVNTNAQGYLRIENIPVAQCDGYVMVTKAEYDTWLSTWELSPAEISSAFTFGLGAILVTGYLSSYGVGLAKKLIRQL
ncbi:single-stranded DNA-binding protein [Photobacterium marinum]|uniref:single-stranded DNA-binding protein n=1 Tax=Photobacterium marinum TaxID=1056511 RepID=UPI0012F8991A|nr:single-stranded DNA-binding protein [Photobacterium marinum]